jgi:hypothetical protein
VGPQLSGRSQPLDLLQDQWLGLILSLTQLKVSLLSFLTNFLNINGFSKPWESFVRGIVAREHMPSWERLWDDFVQEELRVGLGSTSQQRGGDDGEDLALSAKGKKKTKKGPKGGAKQQQKVGEQQRDMSKVKCFACNKLGHYAG